MNYFECSGVDRSVLNYPTIAKANGAIAQFKTDLNRNLLHAICNFSATQASGTPTPATPLQINGVSKVNVIRCGKNLFKYDANNIKTGTTTAQSTRAYLDLGLKGTNKFTISAKIKEGETPTNTNINISKIRTDGLIEVLLVFILVGNTSPTTRTVTINQGERLIFTMASDNPDTALVNIPKYDYQIELGTTQTDFSPYNGTTEIINLGGTYYGGTVDAITGKITLTHQICDLGDYSWSISSLGGGRVYSQNLNMLVGDLNVVYYDIVSNKYISASWNSIDLSIERYNTLIRVHNSNFDGMTPSEIQTALVGTTAVYPLKTPIVVYAQNSAEIPTIQGDNNAFCDTGNIDIDYILSVDKYIQNQQ